MRGGPDHGERSAPPRPPPRRPRPLGAPHPGRLEVPGRGRVVGLVPDIAAEMAKSLKVTLEIVETTAPNRIPFLQAGKIDLSIGTITLERAKSISFAGVWVVDGTTMAVLASSGVKDYEPLKSGKTIAAV